ncbi:pentatricopeptide repeat-containing protein At2g22410, mitochondrial [Phalaenopsis equestris]|uniref:pentatricopeptide repeat-containing protein At2g22410, mitochondrial n=1 Tax=Phalaenopsis equestris TaxID=78828 RepID=UPI0009E41F38|nr:pentatricopeptide repeat-containing protein At2g22410, mitochondrial [Phalaenopsis equestris]XP_020580187.1 pentatricopeptide repeat-containing protein At2g22410, mitochondrial [Phalaenopsis equestris]XP_020580188.1 pentatricopeptide repeat-containing protein At2g22410, mitochondrial [Phalaenopsis equestris]
MPSRILSLNFCGSSLVKILKFKTAKFSILSHPIISLLERCQTLAQLKQIQTQMVLSGLISDSLAASRLVAFCTISDSADLDYGSLLLLNLKNPNTFSWNVAIRGYSDSARPKESIFLYKRLLRSTAQPDYFTFPFLFKACSKIPDFGTGILVFGHALQLGLCAEVFVFNSLMRLFVVCGTLADARKLFDESCVRDLVSWNTLINGFVQRGKPREALDLVKEMEEEGIFPDTVTMLGAISSCAQLQALELGSKFHHFLVENGLDFTVTLNNALIDMYMKCGSLELARTLFDAMKRKTMASWTTMITGYAKFGFLDVSRRLFDEMPDKDIIPWNALLAGYVQSRRAKDAVALFHELQASTIEPDEITMVSLLSACSHLGALEMGIWAHQYIQKRKFSLNVALGTALVDMYAKCGNIEKSSYVFREMADKNALTWTAMICGLANHGHASEAIRHFQKMMEIGLHPDEITFIGALSACCHGGLLHEGRMFFSLMTSVYKLKPTLKHYSCMVDLLGRAGLLHEAEEMVKSMPIVADGFVWGALFFACRLHRNVAMGVRAATRLLELDPSDSGIYVSLANLFAQENMRDEADEVWALMKERGVEKTPGCSSIEVNGVVYEFIVRDTSHPAYEEIYTCLKLIYEQMKHFESCSLFF